MHVKFEIDRETAQKLVQYAEIERRPLPWQAEVLFRRGLGLPPLPSVPEEVMTTGKYSDRRDD
jgi:hypothetical protein